MAELVTKVRVFIGSPGDVGAERKALTQTIEDLNIGFASSRKIVLEVAKWETHVWPGFGNDAQSVINDRIGEYDIFIGVFWNRFGTPTGRAASGSAEEFERAYALWKEHKRPSLMLYFRRSPVDLASIEEIRQKQQLLEFKESLHRLGALFREYSDIEEFGRLVALHLIQELSFLEKTAEVIELHKRVDDQQRTISKQEQTLTKQQDVINQLVAYSMASYIFDHLQYVYHGQRKDSGWSNEYWFRKNAPFEHDLRFLRDHGFIEFLEIGSLLDGENLVNRLTLTPVGNFYVELREGAKSGG
jgi:hypothetical protein